MNHSKITSVVFFGLLVLSPSSSLTAEGTLNTFQRSNVTAETVTELRRAALGGADYEEARRVLENVSSNEAIPALINALKVDGVRDKWQGRKLAYAMLTFHHAGETVIGQEQLVAGLSDPSSEIQRACCSALGPIKMAEELRRTIEVLLDQQSPEKEKQLALSKVRGWGTYAQAATDSIMLLFSNRTVSERTRWFSAWAILEICGWECADGLFLETGPVAEKVILWSLSRYLLTRSTPRKPLDSGETRFWQRARSSVLSGLRSPNTEVQDAALEAILPVYGAEGFLAVRTREDYDVDPALKAALESLVTTDAESALGRQASRLLHPDQLAQIVEAILRRRTQEEEHKVEGK